MRAWYVFVVVGFILSAGMVTYGVMVNNNIKASLDNRPIFSYLPNSSCTETPTPTPTPTALVHYYVHIHHTCKSKHTRPRTPPVIRGVIAWSNNTNKFKIPCGYYSFHFRKYKPTYTNLIKLLNHLKCPHKYDPSKFKCSHFAAWLEWYLENHGFKTDVVIITWEVKHNGHISISGHALDKVYLQHRTVYLDPTLLTIPWVHGKGLIVHLKDEIPQGVKVISITTCHNIYDMKSELGYYQINWWDVLGYPPRVN